MSTTDELLEEMLEDVEEYATPVTDDDLQFWIDEHLRVISIPKNGVVAGVEGDKNVNKIKFGMNRYYHDFDMSTFSGRILYSNAKGNKNYYNITDMQASGSAITFSWLVDADAVQYMGKTAFVVYLFKIQGSELRQKFFSTLATLKVLEGMEVDSAVPVEKQTDIIERMKEEISAYAEEVKKSLPADYTAMTEQVSSLKEDLGEKTNQYFINNFVRISRSENLLNYVTNTHDSEISTSDGSIIANTQGYCVSDYIPIGYDKKVVFSHSNSQIYTMEQVGLYDLSKKFIKKLKNVDEVALEENAYFIRVVFKQHDEKVVQVSYNTRLDYVPYQYIIEPVNKKITKKWCAVGDSLTDPYYDVYATYVADNLGMILDNKGIGGTCVARNENATVNQPFVDRIPTYTGYYDIWSIFGGENDSANNTPIGSISDTDKTTFYGAYNLIIANLVQRTNRPTVVLIAPYQSKHNTKPYRDAVLALGEYYGLPVIDLYANSGINLYTKPYYLRDGVHPNQNGVNKLRPYILKRFSDICLAENTTKMPN